MNFLSRSIKAFTGLPAGLLAAHMVAKFLFGLGLGILLCEYVQVSRPAAGWGLIIAAVIVAIPSTYKILSTIGRSS